MKKNLNILGLAVFIIAMLIGCGKAPQAEVDTAKAAVDSLIARGADKILADEFTVVNGDLDEALKIVETQSSKMFKSFGEAKEKLAGVVKAAQELDGEVAKKKAELMEDIEKMLDEIGTMNNDTKNMIPKSGKVSANLLILRKDAMAVDASLKEVTELVKENDLVVAQEKLEEIQKEAERISSEVKAAMTSSSSKPVVKKPKTTHTSSGSLKPMKK